MLARSKEQDMVESIRGEGVDGINQNIDLIMGNLEYLKRQGIDPLSPAFSLAMAEIEKEEGIIDRLMIRTQQNFQKLGGQVKVEIRQSNIPAEYYESLQDAPEEEIKN